MLTVCSVLAVTLKTLILTSVTGSDHRSSSFDMTDDMKVMMMWSFLKELFCFSF